MSARVTSGAPPASTTASLSGGHGPVAGAAARAVALLSGSNPAAAEGDTDASQTDTGNGGSGAAQGFAAALDGATRASGKGNAGKADTHAGAGAAGSSGLDSLPTDTTECVDPGAAMPGSGEGAGSAATAGPPTPAASVSANGAAAIATASLEPLLVGADAATTDSDSADTPGVSGSGSAHAVHRGRTAGGSDTSGSNPGALAMLQSAAAALAALMQPADTAAGAGARTDAASGADQGGLTAISGAGGGGSTAAAAALAAATAGGHGPQAAAVAGAGPSGNALATLLQGGGGGNTGSSPGSAARGATDTAAAAAARNAAARAATLMPQFLSALPAAAGSAGVARAIAVPMSDPGWPQALAAQVHWMAGSQVQSATLRLTPEHLGPVEVRIELQQSQINVTFSAAHADTRAALADAVPRLRDLLAAGGLNLGQANVQQESARGQAPSAGSGHAGGHGNESVESVAIGPLRALGLVDEYV